MRITSPPIDVGNILQKNSPSVNTRARYQVENRSPRARSSTCQRHAEMKMNSTYQAAASSSDGGRN